MKNLFYGEKHSFIEWTYVVVDIGIAPTTYVTEIKEHILKYTLNKNHVHWLSSFKHLNQPISIKIPFTIWQIVYIYMAAILTDFTELRNTNFPNLIS